MQEAFGFSLEAKKKGVKTIPKLDSWKIALQRDDLNKIFSNTILPVCISKGSEWFATAVSVKEQIDEYLMIENPNNYIGEFISAGSDIITVHVEACPHMNRTVQLVKDQEIMVGVVLNPATPLSSLEEILHEIDMVLIMSVNPGFGGQKFIPSMMDKIENLSEIMNHYDHPIALEVDGGITPDNAEDIVKAGASVLVAGSAIFNTQDYKKAINSLRNG